MDVTIGPERETPKGWEYDVTVSTGGQTRSGVVRLSWADHDYLSGGAVAPSRVVWAAVRALVEAEGLAAVTGRLDVSTIQRRVRGLAGRVRSELGEGGG